MSEYKYPPIHEYERFHFLHRSWDICGLWREVPVDFADEQTLDVKNFYDQFLADNDVEWKKGEARTFNLMHILIDKEAAMNDAVDVTIPLLAVTANNNFYDPSEGQFTMVVDGFHRAYKAYHLGFEEIPIILFDLETSNRHAENAFGTPPPKVEVEIQYRWTCPNCDRRQTVAAVDTDLHSRTSCQYCAEYVTLVEPAEED